MNNNINAEKIEDLISKIQGVISTKVVIAENDIIEELHLLTDNSRNAKQISRDVQSALAAELDIQIDHKVISIAQIDFIKDDFTKKRVNIYKVSNTVNKDTSSYEVVLLFDGQEEKGEYKQKNISSRRDYSIVMATLKALEKLFKFEDSIFIEEIEVLKYHDYSIAIVILSTIFDEEEKLSGSSIFIDERNMSLVKATLDAVNRRIKLL